MVLKGSRDMTEPERRAESLKPVALKVLQSIEKISKSCVFKLTPTKLQFIVKDAADAGAQVWCMLPAAAAFDLDAYIIESAHRNEIFLEVPLTHLSRAFKSMAHAHAATIKLTRVPIAGPPAPPLPQPPASGTAPPPPAAAAAMMPVLAITISSESKSGRPLSIVHHVPVIPMRRAATAGLREPRIPASDVFIALPKPLGALKTVVERYSRMAAHVTISANHQGVLAISADGQVGQVETQFEGLVNPTL
ncbi:checkpoint protein Hus1/Mec3, partial [Blastocladiella britannica]